MSQRFCEIDIVGATHASPAPPHLWCWDAPTPGEASFEQERRSHVPTKAARPKGEGQDGPSLPRPYTRFGSSSTALSLNG